jgi:tetratricopeptide (TPR) repeat protein
MKEGFLEALLRISVMALMLIFSCPAFCQENTHTLFLQADALYREKNHAGALPLYQKVIEIDSSYAPAYRGVVLCYGAMGNPQGALKYMDALFLDRPGSAEVHYGMGCALYGLQKYDDAAKYFDKAAAMKPDLAAAWNNRGTIYHFVARDYAKARLYYEKAVEVGTRTGNAEVVRIARENMAHLPREEDMKPMTLEEFLNAFIARADESDAAGVRWLVFGQKGNCSPAMEWLLEQALHAAAQGAADEEKTAVALATLLATEYGAVHKQDALKRELAVYTGLSAGHKKKLFQGNSNLASGVEKERQGDYEEAVQAYREALSCFQVLPDKGRAGAALLYLGDAQRAQKKYAAARKSYTDAVTAFMEVRNEKQRALALTSLGFTCAGLHDYAEAIGFFKRALKIYTALQDEQSAGKVRENIARVEQSMGKGE